MLSYNYRLLEDCVLVVIPMLNPDGVAKGLTRHDSNGLNLNAYYKYAKKKKMPTIWALKELIKYNHTEGNVWAIFDLHSHTTKRGIFFFSNPLFHNTYNNI